MLTSIVAITSNDFLCVFNLLKKHKVDIINVSCNNIKIYTKDLYKVCRILKRKDIKYQIVKQDNIKSFIKKMLFYFPIFISLITMLFFTTFNTKSVYSIEVKSMDTQLNYEIKEYIKEKYSFPLSIQELNINEVKIDVIEHFKEVGFCEIEIDKNKIVLSIEKIKQEIPNEKKEGKILSNYDAIITKVLVYSGSAKVKVGDTIKRGTLLIDDCIVNPQIEGEYIKTKALGDVYGRVYYSRKLCIPKYTINHILTGKKSIKYEIHILKNHIIDIGKNKFKNYTLKTSKINLYSILGIQITKNVYKEITTKQLEIEEFELEEEIAKIKSEMVEQFPDKSRIIDTWVIKKCLDNIYFVDIYYEVEQCISIEEDYYRSSN